MKKRLGWCSQCKEYSTKVRITKESKRIEICLNAGHGYIRTLPPLIKEEVFEEDKHTEKDLHPAHPDNK